MTYQVIFSIKAKLNMRDIAKYIGAYNPVRAITFSEELYDRAFSLTINPQRFQRVSKSRRLVHGNYLIYYRINESKKRVTILLVTEGHRAY